VRDTKPCEQDENLRRSLLTTIKWRAQLTSSHFFASSLPILNFNQ